MALIIFDLITKLEFLAHLELTYKIFYWLFCLGPHPLQQVRGQQADPLHPPREEYPVLEAGAAEVEHPTPDKYNNMKNSFTRLD